MTDAVDLSTCTIHNSPPDIASWPATHAIVRVELKNDTAAANERGFAFVFDPPLPDAWKWPSNPAAPSENFQYTVWIVLRVDNAWHAAGFIQMWQGRPATGAPLEEHWDDWAYDISRWGGMVNMKPQPGTVVGLFVSAGNARGRDTVSSVRERSNVVAITLPPNDQGVFTFNGDTPAPGPTPTPAPSPHPTPAPAPTPGDELVGLLLGLTTDVHGLRPELRALTAAVNQLNVRIDTMNKAGIKVHL